MGTAKVDYSTYMASREWRLKRQEVMEVNGGLCFRCQSAKATQVHHLTYAHLGNEFPEDLQPVCRPCHEYLSGITDNDPAFAIILTLLAQGLEPGPIDHFGLRTWWETKTLPNGRWWAVSWEPTDSVDIELRAQTVVFAIKEGLWFHCFWM